MGTMNFSIPDDLKERFNAVFKDANKSAIIAQLMERAIENEERRQRGETLTPEQRQRRFDKALQRLSEARRFGRTYSDEEIRKLRDDGRS
jgi:hypothetical protein